MVFYFLITAVTIALAGLMDAVWTRTGQEAGSAGLCAGQAAESAASGNGRHACGISSSGGGTSSAGFVPQAVSAQHRVKSSRKIFTLFISLILRKSGPI